MERQMNLSNFSTIKTINLSNSNKEKSKLFNIKKVFTNFPISEKQISLDGSMTGRDFFPSKYMNIKNKTIYNENLSNSNLFRNSSYNNRNQSKQSSSHSILNKFSKDVVDSFNNSIRKTKENYIMTLYKAKPNLLPSKTKKKLDKEKFSNPFFFDYTEEEDEELGINSNINSNVNSNIHSYINSKESKNKKTLSEPSIKSLIKSSNSNTNRTSNSNSFADSKSNIISYSRFRTFKPYLNEKRILENKVFNSHNNIYYKNNLNPVLQKDLKFQSSILKDEISILIDDIKNYQKNCFYNPLIIPSFKNNDLIYQVKVNKLLEETNSLLYLIPNLLLGSYFTLIKENITLPEPSKKDFIPKFVKNETECFVDNGHLLNKILKCLIKYYELYLDLIYDFKDNTMLIKKNKFHKLLLILKKTRYLIGELNNSGINSIKNLKFEKKLIKKFKPIKNPNSDKIKKKYVNKFDIFQRIADNMSFKGNEEKQKTSRINMILNANHEKIEEKIKKQRNHEILMKQKNISKYIIVRNIHNFF